MAEKVGILQRTSIFFGEVRTEMSKVVWPTREQVWNYTLIVLGFTACVSLLIGLWDIVLGWGINQLFHLTT